MGAESLVWFLILVAIFGLIIGALGRLLVPGPTPLGRSSLPTKPPMSAPAMPAAIVSSTWDRA